MSRIQNRTIIGVTGLILAAGPSLGLLHDWKQTARDTAPRGRYTSAQIVRMAERVCRAVDPGGRYESIALEHSTGSGPNSPQRQAWLAECTTKSDEDGSPPAVGIYCKWDAESGQLLNVSRNFRLADGPQQTISPGEAVRRSARWLRRLEMIDSAAPLALAYPPEQNGVVWVVRFRIRAQHATVRVSMTDDDLQSADYW